MWVLPVIGYIGLLGGFAFLTLAIASGLYYLSELVEEHTVPAKKLLSRLIYVIIGLQVLLTLIDGLPWVSSAVSIVSHAIYLQNMRYFPIVRLTDPIFILSCLLVLLNHYLWFSHFSAPPENTSYSYYSTANQGLSLPSFTEIASFFFLQVWLVPFALFVSLSASENVLPSMGSEYATGAGAALGSGSTGAASGSSSGMGLNFLTSRGGGAGAQDAAGADSGLGDVRGGRKKAGAKSMVRVAVDGAREWVSETGELMGLWQGERTRRW